MSTNTEASSPQRPQRFAVDFAMTPKEITEAQKLRYRIFAGELGATIQSGEAGIDKDQYDEHCHHLVVRDLESNRIIACTRILTDQKAIKAGGFYSAGEFDLSMLDSLPGRVMEVGRTCVDAEFRSGAVIALLWTGLAEFIISNGFDYLFGCASIPLDDGGANAHAVIAQLKEKHMAPAWQRVRPYTPFPAADVRLTQKVRMPPLLKAYISLGLKACGEAYWDRDFNCADVFMLLNVSDMHPRYARHFMDRAKTEETALAAGHA
jgi:putative hemolysin